MKIAIIGGGPAGLFAGIMLKQAFSGARIDVFERNPENVTWGFGVVFSDTALAFLKAGDQRTHDLIVPHMEVWRDLTLDLMGERITLDGIGFAAIGRLALLQILTARAREVGLAPSFGVEAPVGAVPADAALQGYDLVIGADGVNSAVRHAGDFAVSVENLSNKFIWYGAKGSFDTLTQSFRDSEYGRFNAHHYRYAEGMSTFIVETDEATWKAAGLDGMSERETRAVCEEVFADVLAGRPLVSNNSYWRNFPKIWCDRWVDGKTVLIGDAVHTAHFSIGSGTRLAMEDAIALTEALQRSDGAVAPGLADYQAQRKPVVEKIVKAANRSALWYQDFTDHMDLPAWEFADRYVRRAGRIDDDRLRSMSPRFMAGLDAYRQQGEDA